jgi:hypothetical protein
MGHNAIRRSGDRVAEGAPLLREYAGKNLHRGFESLSLRQDMAREGPQASPAAKKP